MPPAPLVRGPDGAADGGRPRSGGRRSRSPTSAGELAWPDGTALGIVEGAGGPRSPLADDGDTVDLTVALDPDAVVLVAHAGLGTINAVRLAAPPLRAIAPVTVVLNRYDGADELHRRNRAWLTGRAGLAVVDSVAALVARIT